MKTPAETVNSGSAEPDQVKTCEGNKSNSALCVSLNGRRTPITPPSSDKPSPYFFGMSYVCNYP